MAHRWISPLPVLAAIVLMASVAQAALEDYQADIIDTGRRTLSYRYYVPPDYDPAKAYPLVVFLHGHGERGDDNMAQVLYGGAPYLLNQLKKPQYEAIMLAPQVSIAEGGSWTGGTRTGANWTQALTLDAIDRLRSQYNIDDDRLYLTGLSGGGAGAWEMGIRHTEEWDWAAMIPICGWGHNWPEELAGIAINAFHAANDTTVGVAGTLDMIARLQSVGLDPEYTIYPTGGHGIWGRVYGDNDVMDWMFSQSIPEPATLSMIGLGGLALLRRRH